MRALAVVLLLLAVASSAGADELIRFRAADGTLGLVDHPSKVPPGAIVVERSEKRAPERPPPDEPLPEAAAAPAPAPEPEQSRKRCTEYGLEPGCDPALLETTGSWCQRGLSVRASLEHAEERVADEEEDYANCRTAGGVVPYCSRRQLDLAEANLEGAEQALEELTDACRAAGCLPGWVRAGCEP